MYLNGQHRASLFDDFFRFFQLNKLGMTVRKKLNYDFFSFIDDHPGIKALTINAKSLSLIDQSKIAKSLLPLEKIAQQLSAKMFHFYLALHGKVEHRSQKYI